MGDDCKHEWRIIPGDPNGDNIGRFVCEHCDESHRKTWVGMERILEERDRLRSDLAAAIEERDKARKQERLNLLGYESATGRAAQLTSDLAAAREEIERLRKAVPLPTCPFCGAELDAHAEEVAEAMEANDD